MKTLILATLFLVVPIAHASTNVYEPINGSCGVDHAVIETATNLPISCIPLSDWKNAQAPTNNDNFITVSRGQTIMTTNNQTDTCPLWFPFACVVERLIFSKFI